MATTGREFFTVKTVSEALTGFRPAHVTAVETVPLAMRAGACPPPTSSPGEALPGFDRSSVDGYAVRAPDTFGASESIPGYLRVVGAVRMGAGASEDVGPRRRGRGPHRRDAARRRRRGRDDRAHAEATADTIEVVRPVAPGENVVRFDEDAAPGTPLVPAGRPLRAQDVALLAAAGVVEVSVHAAPRVTILATGDEIDAPDTAALGARARARRAERLGRRARARGRRRAVARQRSSPTTTAPCGRR